MNKLREINKDIFVACGKVEDKLARYMHNTYYLPRHHLDVFLNVNAVMRLIYNPAYAHILEKF